MRGEYKVPGGKLVIADFEVEDGKLENVSINGDFFLEPPEALDDISSSLEGAGAGESEDELARRIRDSLDEGVEMVGFDADAVARAVRRGLE
jgi:lipoate---protein ligase